MRLTGLGHEMAWAMIEAQNMEYLGETFSLTAEKIGEDESIYYKKLSDELREWVANQIDEGTEVFMDIQAAQIDIEELTEIILFEIGEFPHGIPDEHMAWAWHLLHTEQ